LSLLSQAGSSWFAIVQAIVQKVPAVAPPPPPPPPPPSLLQIPLLHSVLVLLAVVHLSPIAFVPPPSKPASPDELAPDELAPELLLDELEPEELLDDEVFPEEEDELPLDDAFPELLPSELVSSSPHATERPARPIRPAANAIRPRVASFIRRNLHDDRNEALPRRSLHDCYIEPHAAALTSRAARACRRRFR
jgi:hypothetical protein